MLLTPTAKASPPRVWSCTVGAMQSANSPALASAVAGGHRERQPASKQGMHSGDPVEWWKEVCQAMVPRGTPVKEG